ncbi:MAG: penicillin-binding protein activator [Paracoccaceae bacterium]
MFAVLTPARKLIARLTVLLSALWLAACEPISINPMGNSGQKIDPNAPVPVALLVPRGSGNSGDDLLAKNFENAARLAISDLEGVKIDLRVYGTAGDPAQAQQAGLQAVADGAKIIIGPLYAESANAVAVAVANQNVNVLSFSNNTTIAGGNLFVLGPTFGNTADRLVKYAARNGKKRIMLAHDNNVAGQLGAQAIESAIAGTGAQLAGKVGYELSQQGVVAAAPKIAQAAQAGGADALFLTANTAGALPLLTQMLPEQGLPPASIQYIGLSRWDIPAQVLELPGVQGGWFALPDPNMTARFRSRYSAAFGSDPHPLGGLAYDGIAAIGALVKSGRENALTTVGLTQNAGFQGVNGIFRLRPNGTNERGLAVAQIKNKQVVVIDPAPRAFGGAGF